MGRAVPTPHPTLGLDGGGGRSEDAPTQFTLPESASGALELPCPIAIMVQMFSYLACRSSSSA